MTVSHWFGALLGSSAVLIAAPAAAQHGPAVPSLDLPAEPLARALARFTQATGVIVVADGTLVRGRTSTAVSGPIAPDGALRRLLAGTSLRAEPDGRGGYVLVKPTASPRRRPAPRPMRVRETHEDQPERSNGSDIVVTGLHPVVESRVGTKTSTPLIETPQSISIISAGQIDAQGAQSVGEALRYMAGVNPEEYGGTDQRIDTYLIRGFANTMPFVDGLPTNGRYTLLSTKVDPYGLDGIEILRGPSSVLYGQNVPGGLVNLVSKRPLDVAAGELAVQTGSYGRIEGRADLTGPVDAAGTLLYRVTGLALNTGTQVDHVRNRRYFIAPALTWRPDDATSVTFLSHLQRQEDGFALQNLPAAGTLYAAPFGFIPRSLFTGEPDLNRVNRTQWDVGYQAEHRFGERWSVRQNLRYAHVATDIGYVAGYGEGGAQGQIMGRFSLAARAHQNNFALDNQVEGHLETGAIQHIVLVGVNYSQSHDVWDEQDGSASPLDITHPVYGQPYTLAPVDFATVDTLRQIGVYAQDQMKLGRLVVTGGIRHDWAYTRSNEQDIYVSQDTRQHDRAFTGRGGAVYLFDNGLAPYVSYSTSFQPTPGLTFTGTPFRPTTAKQWEGGIKYQPKSARSFVTLSAFEIRERNVLTADPLHNFQQVQTGGIRVRGVEASGNLDFGHGFSSTVAYSYLDPTITRSNDGYVGNLPKDVSRNSGSLWLDKLLPVTASSRLTLGGGVRYMGPRYGDNANMLRLPGNTQFDALARYDLDGWQITLNARNVADKRIVATCDSAARCFYGERRSIIATLGHRW